MVSMVIVLLLTHFCGGRSQEIDKPLQIITTVGMDIVLPCQLEPPTDAVSITMEWGRMDLNPRFVYVWHDGQELLTDQNKAYMGRASLSIAKLKRGDLSLTLSKVNVSDNGIYRCLIPKLSKEYFVELLVGAGSSPTVVLAGIHKDSSGVMIDCKSGGWYPKPEVSWLDGEGHVLSAGPPETVRGPDGVYTVSSRVTVEERDGNRFTCRVHQKTINQTRETQIHVPGGFFITPSSCTTSVSISVLFGLMLLLVSVFFGWKWRQMKQDTETKCETRRREEDSKEQLMAKTKEVLDLGKKSTLQEELHKKEEEQKHTTFTLNLLMGLMKEMETQKKEITDRREKTEKQMEENENKFRSVEKDVSEKKNDASARAQAYLTLKEILSKNFWTQEERKVEHQQLKIWTEKLKEWTLGEVKRLTERKNEVEQQIEQIKKQMGTETQGANPNLSQSQPESERKEV